MSITELTTETFDNAVSSGVALVEFWAPWCGPCKAMAPIMEQLEVKFAGQAKVAKVNIEEQVGLVSKFNIRSIPFTAIFKDGQVVKNFVGSQSLVTLQMELGRVLK